jgi:hypothetical protein
MYQRYRQLLPVLILLFFCICTLIHTLVSSEVIDGQTYYPVLSAKHYSAFAFTALAVASFFLFRPYYKYSLLLIFGLGIFGLLAFTTGEMTVGLGIGPIKLAIPPVLLLFGLLIFLLNYQKINTSLFALIKPSEERLARVRQEEIEEFKTRFTRKSAEELTQIATANRLVPTAVAAARQLLAERQAEAK